ncbi:serine protease DegS [Litorivivens lipolytica]|uniref:Serine protease DegS n=1 Tax=Litorivivens lipolytica TaxID=1524264 RepID=A0A7W4Z6Q2_9GAMM|nr:trypsin-like peptidase domain-containing protein [Litorivivens lipolytica]MBB3047101.1 serine protease DegS [Litorivivens lipolytica]
MPNSLRWLLWPVIAGLVAGLAIVALRQPAVPAPLPASSSAAPGYASAFNRAAPAVVNIYTSKVVQTPRSSVFEDPILRHFFRRGNPAEREKVERSLGSGVIVSDQGYLLTNLHVIQGADEILVLLQDGRQSIARLIGSDPETDLAVLKINLPELQPIALGNTPQVQVGDIVLAIGNPYGFGQSMSQGIVSAKGRYGLGLTNYENFIQTDAAINPGNSGGALVDHEGRLIGINTAIYTQSGGSTGIGLAIPADLALRTMKDIIEYGRPVRGWLGLEVKSVAPQSNGVVISAIMPGGPAAKAGLKIGDVIFAINETPVGDGHAGMNEIAATRPGSTVSLDFARAGERQRLDIVVGIRPAPVAASG